MATLQQLIAQKEALEREIEQTQQQGRTDAIVRVRELMDEYGLTTADLATKASPKAGAGKGKKVAVKYRNATGDTWSGRGLQPKWLKAALAAGRKLGDFAV